VSDELKELREENHRLAAALTDCNHGFSQIALKLATVAHIIGFATDDELAVIRAKTQQHANALHNANQELIGLRQASSAHVAAGNAWAREKDQLLLQIEVLEKELHGG
jgi:LDH2 family malate/lactate/ureidoglycolate dehydrogenase